MRILRSYAVTILAAAALLAACAQPGTAPSPAGGDAPQGSATAATPVSVSPTASARDADSCGDHGEASADTCGATAESCGDGAPSGAAQAAALALRRVPADQVCMRSNRFMGRLQPSAEVDGHAYHGCCAGCTKHLGESAAARTANDPVTGNPVDKATAVIGARPDGSVVYFESAETFARAGGA